MKQVVYTGQMATCLEILGGEVQPGEKRLVLNAVADQLCLRDDFKLVPAAPKKVESTKLAVEDKSAPKKA